MNKSMSYVCIKRVCSLDHEVELCVCPTEWGDTNSTKTIMVLTRPLLMDKKLPGTEQFYSWKSLTGTKDTKEHYPPFHQDSNGLR